jgi:hypothetical protein
MNREHVEVRCVAIFLVYVLFIGDRGWLGFGCIDNSTVSISLYIHNVRPG